MCLEAEPEGVTRFPHKITLMVGTLMLVSDAATNRKKWRKERCGLIQGWLRRICGRDRRRWGISDAMSAKGIVAAKQMPKRTWYTGEPEGLEESGISITVPARSYLVSRSKRLTRVLC